MQINKKMTQSSNFLTLVILIVFSLLALWAAVYLKFAQTKAEESIKTQLNAFTQAINTQEEMVRNILFGETGSIQKMSEQSVEFKEEFRAVPGSTAQKNYRNMVDVLEAFNATVQDKDLQWFVEQRDSVLSLFDQLASVSNELAKDLNSEQGVRDLASIIDGFFREANEATDPEIKDAILEKVTELNRLASTGLELRRQSNLIYVGNIDLLSDFFVAREEYNDLFENVNFADYEGTIFEPTLDALSDANGVLSRLDEVQSSIDMLYSSAQKIIREVESIEKEADLDYLTGKNTTVELTDIPIPSLGISLPSRFLYISYATAALFAFVTLVQFVRQFQQSREADKMALEQNRRTEESILGLLDTMTGLSEGDLTVQAKVTDDITGAISDAFNYSVEELRGLVSTVKDSSVRVAEAVGVSSGVAKKLLEASHSQAEQIADANDVVSNMAISMNNVASQTSLAMEIANSSSNAARLGAERVRQTIAGMDQIREHIQETAKRIKRLGESSQEIGDIVELINDIADQTHILALNAAIQASAAGEAGRGFAVVADEVQRLAERTGSATKRVESLVKTIQGDTHEAVAAMEKSTSEVVAGANLAERAGESLTEIEEISAQLASLVQSVSMASNDVSVLGSKVREGMDSIRMLTEENVNSTQITIKSVEELQVLSEDLKSSVSGFRVPPRAVK